MGTINFRVRQDMGTILKWEKNKGGFNEYQYTFALVCALYF